MAAADSLETSEDTPPPKRTTTRWMILLGTWVVGLLMWAFYIVAILYLLFRTFFSAG